MQCDPGIAGDDVSAGFLEHMTAAQGVIKLIPSWGEIKNRYLVLSDIARALLAGNATAGRDPRLHPRDRGHHFENGTNDTRN